MITVHVLSPQNELNVVERLKADIVKRWPSVAASATDRIDLFAGVRTGMDVDLLVAIDLADPRPLSNEAQRDGTAHIHAGLIVIEIKQKDASSFQFAGGNQIFPIENGKPATRSVTDQARDAMSGVLAFARQSVDAAPYIYSLAWLTEVDQAQLEGVDPRVIGRQADWLTILRASLLQHPQLSLDDAKARAATRAVRDRLLIRRTLSPLDRAKAERIARDEVRREFVEAVAPDVGTKAIRLAGHGGSGKTTTLVLLAIRLAARHDKRTLILTFHHALRNDIRRVIEGFSDGVALLGGRIEVETATMFLMALVEAAGHSVPRKENGEIDFTRTEACYAEAAAFLERPDGELMCELVRNAPDRFDWDAILVDESQDWTDGERDLLLAAYGHKRLVLADGLVQLIRRQQSCAWLKGVPKDERDFHELGIALRQQRIVAEFTNAFAAALGFADWHVEPQPQLSGGRVIVIEGHTPSGPALAAEMITLGAQSGASAADNLICIPPTEVTRADDGARHARIGADLRAAGHRVWDAIDPSARQILPEGRDAWRILQYDSCRGLEGWITLLIAFDDLYTQKLKYPNLYEHDRPIDPAVVARRWLLIPLTRAVHALIIHVRDPQSSVAIALREAASSMPVGTVEYRSSLR